MSMAIYGPYGIGKVPPVLEALSNFFPAFKCGGSNHDLCRVFVDDGLAHLRDEIADSVKGNPKGVAKTLVAVSNSQISESDGQLQSWFKSFLEGVLLFNSGTYSLQQFVE